MPPASHHGGAQLELRADTTDFRRLFDRSSQVDPVLKRGLRRNIRQVASGAAQDVQRTVLRSPARPAATPRHTGLREGIAAGVKVAVLTGNARIGVQVIGSGAQLPAGQRNLLRAYGRAGGWRHPSYGNTAVWVTQIGRPGYFYPTVAAHRGELTRAVTAAMQEAADSLRDTRA